MWKGTEAFGTECVSNIAYPHTSTAETRHLLSSPKFPSYTVKSWD